jgi:hypothetical protein
VEAGSPASIGACALGWGLLMSSYHPHITWCMYVVWVLLSEAVIPASIGASILVKFCWLGVAD